MPARRWRRLRPQYWLVLFAVAGIVVVYLLVVHGPFHSTKVGTVSQWVSGLGALTAIGYTLWLEEKRTDREEARREKERQEQAAELAREAEERARLPHIEVTKVEPVFMPSRGGWLIRLRVTNLEPIAWPFRASVTKADDMSPYGPEQPWPIPWRHSLTRTVELSPNAAEFLLLAAVGMNTLDVNVHEYDGREFARHGVANPTSPNRLRVTIVEGKQGRTVAEYWLNIPVPTDLTMERAPDFLLAEIESLTP